MWHIYIYIYIISQVYLYMFYSPTFFYSYFHLMFDKGMGCAASKVTLREMNSSYCHVYCAVYDLIVHCTRSCVK